MTNHENARSNQFTPGPWLVSETITDAYTGLTTTPIHSESGTLVAEVFSGNRKANAQLIAAAPELLAALNKLIAHTLVLENGTPSDLLVEVSNLRNKAEGRA